MFALRINGKISRPRYVSFSDACRAADAVNEIRPDARVDVEEIVT